MKQNLEVVKKKKSSDYWLRTAAPINNITFTASYMVYSWI